MIIISAGFRKSASTLIYDFEVGLIGKFSNRKGQKELERFSTGRGRAYRGRLDLKTFLILLYINFRHGDVVLKTHGSPTFFIELLISLGLAKATYTYRDPRDVILSMMDHGKRTREKDVHGENTKLKKGFSDVFSPEDTMPYINEDIQAWYKWSSLKNVLTIEYENLMANKEKELGEIASFLGFEGKEADLEELVQKYSNFKNNNFNKGEAGRYLSEMSPDSLEYLKKYIGNDLKKMGYSIN
ncbi:hypothetical protein C7271_10655 [filamentous cyanobacterium CCP5]|nr:hypothetical protein C7271_10655 [filamentous cyanobacterium CCP5]